MKSNSCLRPAPARRPLAALRPVLLAALLAVLLLSGCQKATEAPAPAQLLSPDQMMRVLVELHTLEARTEGGGPSPDSTLALFRQEQKKIYWRYEVTDSAFTQSYRYYATHEPGLNDIYTAVVDSLAIIEARNR